MFPNLTWKKNKHMIESMVDKERNRREKPKARHAKLLKAFTVAGNC
jgi:hypothetical protein